MILRRLLVVSLTVCSSGLALCQLMRGHVTEQDSDRAIACSKATERAGRIASMHWDKTGPDMSLKQHIFNENGRCTSSCSQQRIHGNPAVWSCTVRWELRP